MKRSRRFREPIAKTASVTSPVIAAATTATDDYQDVVVKLRVRGETRKAMASMGDGGMYPTLAKAIVVAIQKATAPSEPPPTVTPVEPSPTLKFARVIVSKAETAEEERYVLGVVMEPDEVDTQGHTETSATIRKAQQAWMEAYRTDGEAGHFTVQHARTKDGKVLDSNDKFAVLECYIQKSDETYEGQFLKAGSWMMAERVLDDDMWSAIKKGEITGFSIGGTAVVNPLD
jgi:DNA adenine methylase